MKNLTFKRILKQHKGNPQDEKLHRIIESGNVDEKKFDDLVGKATKQEPFDKK